MPKELKVMGKFTGLDSLKIAKDMKCKIRYYPLGVKKTAQFVEMRCDRHDITVGRENSKYFINTGFRGRGIWHKRKLTKRQVDKLAVKALAGFDLGELLKKRFRKK